MTETPMGGRRHVKESKFETYQSTDDDTGIVDSVVSAAKGQDEPMGKSNPAGPPALVFLAYPLALIAVAIVVAISFWMFGGFFGGEEVVE